MDLLATLNMADIELLEEISGVSMSQMDDESKPRAKLMIGLAFIISRKKGHPKSLDEIRAMPLSEIESVIADLDEEEPANP